MKMRTALKKLLGLLMCCVTLIGLLPATAFADDITKTLIPVVKATTEPDFAAPAYKAQVNRYSFSVTAEGDVTEIPRNMGYWERKESNGKFKKYSETDNPTFEEGTYRYCIQVRADSTEYYIGEKTVVYINGVKWNTGDYSAYTTYEPTYSCVYFYSQEYIVNNIISVSIKNNPGSKTIDYGEKLVLTAVATNLPSNAKLCWYVDGELKGEGETFEISPKSGSVEVAVKIIGSDGNALKNSDGNEISDSQKVSVNSGFFKKIISFFKNLFGINRTVIQTVI